MLTKAEGHGGITCPVCGQGHWRCLYRDALDPAEDRFRCACGCEWRRYERKPLPPSPPVPATDPLAAARAALLQLTDEERLEAMNEFCRSCGRIQPPDRICQCWNDE